MGYFILYSQMHYIKYDNFWHWLQDILIIIWFTSIILNIFIIDSWVLSGNIRQKISAEDTKEKLSFWMGYRSSASWFFIHTRGGAQETFLYSAHFEVRLPVVRVQLFYTVFLIICNYKFILDSMKLMLLLNANNENFPELKILKTDM